MGTRGAWRPRRQGRRVRAPHWPRRPGEGGPAQGAAEVAARASTTAPAASEGAVRARASWEDPPAASRARPRPREADPEATAAPEPLAGPRRFLAYASGRQSFWRTQGCVCDSWRSGRLSQGPGPAAARPALPPGWSGRELPLGLRLDLLGSCASCAWAAIRGAGRHGAPERSLWSSYEVRPGRAPSSSACRSWQATAPQTTPTPPPPPGKLRRTKGRVESLVLDHGSFVQTSNQKEGCRKPGALDSGLGCVPKRWKSVLREPARAPEGCQGRQPFCRDALEIAWSTSPKIRAPCSHWGWRDKVEDSGDTDVSIQFLTTSYSLALQVGIQAFFSSGSRPLNVGSCTRPGQRIGTIMESRGAEKRSQEEPESPTEIVLGLTTSGLKAVQTAFFTMDKTGFLWGDRAAGHGGNSLHVSRCSKFSS